MNILFFNRTKEEDKREPRRSLPLYPRQTARDRRTFTDVFSPPSLFPPIPLPPSASTAAREAPTMMKMVGASSCLLLALLVLSSLPSPSRSSSPSSCPAVFLDPLYDQVWDLREFGAIPLSLSHPSLPGAVVSLCPTLVCEGGKQEEEEEGGHVLCLSSGKAPQFSDSTKWLTINGT